VGAWHYNGSQGSAYVFTRSGTSWSQQAHLTADDGAALDDFGWSVALFGDTALVGAWLDAIGENLNQGSAYVFVRSGTNWSQQAKLTAPDAPGYDRFGYSVALSGETALVGSYNDDVGATINQGSAYVFVRSGTSWSQQAQLTAADGAAYDVFGSSVALSGETALVGASSDDVGANVDQGSAYVFARSGTSWSPQGKLTGADGAAHDYFGWAVALSGETALVGVPYDQVGLNAEQGSAYLFARSGGNWSRQGKLTASDGAASDNFGWAVALSGETALVGAAYDTVGSSEGQGSVRVLLLPPADTTPPTTVAGLSSSQPATATGWFHTSPVTVSLTADDGSGSGVLFGNTRYRPQGAGPWTTYIAPFTVSAAGTSVYEFYSQDAVGNAETVRTVTLNIDTVAPVTTADGLQVGSTGWINHSQTVTLTPSDDGGSGLAATYFTLDGVQHTYSGPFAVSAAGSHSIAYWSTDNAGNEGTHGTGHVSIDTGTPISTATRNVTVTKGKKATLAFRIADPAPSCGTATVTITIKLKAKTVKTISVRNVTTNEARSYAFKVTLKKGSYTWTVKATDIAGNVGKAGTARKLTVK
jgi:hypothetical protein